MDVPNFTFESYGVLIQIKSSSPILLEEAKDVAERTLLGNLVVRSAGHKTVSDNILEICQDSDGKRFYLSNGDPSITVEPEIFAKILNSKIRLIIAEKAYPWVFIHAGVVEWKGKAIVLPGPSFHGKTTLVSELIKAGARYMSDEYAVLGSDGLIYPFARDLAVRVIQGEHAVPVPPSNFGAEKQGLPVEAALVAISKYAPGSSWDPEVLTLGNGLLEMIPQVISINFNTEFALKVLNTAFNRAIIIRSLRGEAPETAQFILNFFDNNLDLDRIS